MIYIRNCSNRIIHLADAMLLPDDKVEDKDPRTGKAYSDSPVINTFIEKGMLELVDVRPIEKTNPAEKKEIKVEFEEVDGVLEDKGATEEVSAPTEATEKTATPAKGRRKKEA